MVRRPAGWLGLAVIASFGCLAAAPAGAVPSFARQTGFECMTCHVSWPELTAVGRQFKLGGYTLMKPTSDGERPLVSFAKDTNPPLLPLAAFVQTSISHTARAEASDADRSSFPRQDALALQQLSVFLAGRVNDHVGGFVQWSYDGVGRHSSIDNTDLRVAGRTRVGERDLQVGLSLNNSPTMSDVYNTTPVWGFPFASSSVAPAPAAATLIQGGLAQQVAGLTGYALWNHMVYVEAGGYRTADGMFSLLRAGIDRSTAAQLDGTAPYWRLALQREWDDGTQSAMLGTFGLVARKWPDPNDRTTPSNRFDDTGIDAQYQYVGDVHRLSGQLSYIRETQNLAGSFAVGGASQRNDTLTAWSSKLTYYYQAKYGASLAYQRIGGSTDPGLYPSGTPITGSASGSPDSSAAILELNWLPWRDRRFTLQYTAYQRFNGASRNYDGFGRNAKDNNTLYLLGWFVF